MKYFYLTIIIIGTFLSSSVLKAQNEDLLDAEGTDFWFTFPPNAHNTDGFASTDSLYIYITSKTPTKGKIYYNEVANNVITPIVKDFEITQPNEVYKFVVWYYYVGLRGAYYNYNNSISSNKYDNEIISVKSFHITTEEKSVVYALDYADKTCDAFIVLPTPSLGTEYFIMSYYSSYSGGGLYPSQFAVVGVEDTTMVTIVPTVNTHNSMTIDTQRIMLNQGEVYLVQANVVSAVSTGDLTGTHILADKGIAVIAGHQRTAIPQNGSSRDCLLAQMLPVSTWGKNAIITPFAVKSNECVDIFRVLASRDNTEIYIDGSFVTTLNKGKYYQAEHLKASVISSNNPIMVATFMRTSSISSTRTGLGDPSMIVVPPVEQYKNSYTLINAPLTDKSGSIFKDQYIDIIAPIEAIDKGLYLNGNLLPLSSFTAIGETDYYYINYKSSDGTHNLNSVYPFCVITYGYGDAVSYGYLGGMSMHELDDISLVVVPDECFHTFQVTYTESFHSGITSVEIIDTTNCSLDLIRQTKWKIIWDLIKKDITKDAIIKIKVTDIYGKDSIYIDTISTGYLLGTIEDIKKIDFGKITIGKMDTATINIQNNGLFPITLNNDNFILANNTNFTISKSVFPITINPNDIAEIKLFYAPTRVNMKTIYDIDSLIINIKCLDSVIIELIGEPTADTSLMYGVCNIPIVLIGDTIDINSILPTISPNPTNSSSNAIKYRFSILEDSDLSIKIFDISGKHIDVFTGFLCEGGYEILINISDLTSDIYFIRLETDKYSHSNKLLIER